MVGTLAALAVLQASDQVVRGRDPWVFRAIFEDRPHSLIVAAGHDIWFAFNSNSCAFHKIWKGKVDFRGKVFDFSQENSKAEGTVLAQSGAVVFELPDGKPLPEGWSSKGVTWAGGWKFDGDGAYIESPELDLSAFTNLYVAFDEKSRKGRLRVEVVDDGKVAEWFGSSMDVSSDTNWMWNFKYLLDRGEHARLRFVQVKASDQKYAKALRLYGDRPGWAVSTPTGVVTAEAKYKGYEVNGTKSVKVFFDLIVPGGKVSLAVVPEVSVATGETRWTTDYEVTSATSGYRPVLMGWNQFFAKGTFLGEKVKYLGIDGMRLESDKFELSGVAK